MITVKEFFDKIKWDKKEKKEKYEVSYFDRISKKEIKINYENIEQFDNNFFYIEESMIPIRRIRKIYKNGKLFWERK